LWAAIAAGALFLAAQALADTGGPTVPADVLQLFQKQANSPPWNQDPPTKTQAILQQCAALQQLIAGGATDDVLSNALAASHVRASVFMTFGESLYNSGDTHHAEMFFATVVQDHPARATVKQLGRCYLWIARLHKDDGLAWKYQQQSPDQAAPEFQTALANFLAAKNVSAPNDWVRDVGWLGAADCYHELGSEALRQQCFVQLLAETNPFPIHRDMASCLLAASYVGQRRWQDAIQVYQQMYAQLSAVLANGQQQYAGQTNCLQLITSGLDLCTARLAAQGEGGQ
jgi:tetratricopeptide (TPR) repeat protein